MISVTRLNGSKFVVNALLIETIEQVPDTMITLVNGKKYMILESSSDVVQEIQHYLRSIGVWAAAHASPVNSESEGATS